MTKVVNVWKGEAPPPSNEMISSHLNLRTSSPEVKGSQIRHFKVDLRKITMDILDKRKKSAAFEQWSKAIQ